MCDYLNFVQDFKPKDFPLHEIPLTEWNGFIFLHVGAAGEKRLSGASYFVCLVKARAVQAEHPK